ncbi:hypothetical protein [Nostoc sp.]|uniref:hypothetical protein n=1 Tax=Nostoc sp. TaxID=1180 RepID=UPI002FFC6FDC
MSRNQRDDGTLDRKWAIAFFDFRQNMFCAITARRNVRVRSAIAVSVLSTKYEAFSGDIASFYNNFNTSPSFRE